MLCNAFFKELFLDFKETSQSYTEIPQSNKALVS